MNFSLCCEACNEFEFDSRDWKTTKFWLRMETGEVVVFGVDVGLHTPKCSIFGIK